jgi:putative exosortase-associated protein (TIGR04073 family)
MKKIFVCLVLLVIAASVSAQSVWTCSHVQPVQAVKPVPAKNVYPNPGYGLTRGFANVMFGWMEIPRGFTYENSRIPLVGVVSGPVKGAFLTGWRTIAGVIDIVSLGMSQRGAYFSVLPDYVWDAPWIHRAQYRPTDPDQIMIFNKPRRVDGRPVPPPHPPKPPCGKAKCTCTKPCQLKPPAKPCQLKPARPARRWPLSSNQVVPRENKTVQVEEPFHIESDASQYTELMRNMDEKILVLEGRAAMLE